MHQMGRPERGGNAAHTETLPQKRLHSARLPPRGSGAQDKCLSRERLAEQKRNLSGVRGLGVGGKPAPGTPSSEFGFAQPGHRKSPAEAGLSLRHIGQLGLACEGLGARQTRQLNTKPQSWLHSAGGTRRSVNTRYSAYLKRTLKPGRRLRRPADSSGFGRRRKKAPPEGLVRYLLFTSEGTCRLPSNPQRNDTEGRAQTSAASHRRNAQPRSWLLCRHPDEKAPKKPRRGGASLSCRGSLPPLSEPSGEVTGVSKRGFPLSRP